MCFCNFNQYHIHNIATMSSVSSLELTGSLRPESKRFKMKQFVDAAKEYAKTRNDNTAILMNRYLQVI